jgi:hypothetical protein
MEQGTRNPEQGLKRRTAFRQWLGLLPWDLIYALVVIVLVIAMTLFASLIGLLLD